MRLSSTALWDWLFYKWLIPRTVVQLFKIGKSLLLGCLLLLVLLSGETKNATISLAGQWAFRYDPEGVGIGEEWFKATSEWETIIQVPGFWEDKEYDGSGWFRREFTIDRKVKNKQLALVFESVDDNAEVWINNSYVGSHTGYGEIFWFDITDLVQFGTVNVVTVRIEDIGGPGGINKEIRMEWYGEEKEFLISTISQQTAVLAPDWVREAIIYEIFVRDFSESGDFKGVISKLDELKELSVDCIWLMPVHPVGKINRKGTWGSPYSCVDYYSVTPDFGTLDDFRHLVDETHKRGMRIILDMVLNHSAWDSPLLEQHPDWYSRNERGDVISPNKDWSDVADINYDIPELRKYMIAMLLYWVNDFDVDGFRFDVAELVPEDFWKEARKQVKSAKPEALFLAEGDLPELHLENFDLTYSWNVWQHVIEVCNGRKTTADLVRTLTHENYRYPQKSLRLRFVENHDKLRAAHNIPQAALRLAHAFIYTIPGVPLLYNGEEVGLDHRLTLFEKNPIKWRESDEDFRRFIISLGQLKDNNPDFSSFDWKIVNQDLPEGVIGWTRGISTVCYANFGTTQKQFSVEGTDVKQNEMAFSISESAEVKTEFGKTDIILQPWDLIVLENVE